MPFDRVPKTRRRRQPPSPQRELRPPGRCDSDSNYYLWMAAHPVAEFFDRRLRTRLLLRCGLGDRFRRYWLLIGVTGSLHASLSLSNPNGSLKLVGLSPT